MILFPLSLMLVSVLAAGVASIAGFGIGSLITPFLAIKTGTGLAVAAVSFAHFLGTAFRFIKWRKFINKKILMSFGITSAAGGLMGALCHQVFQNGMLTLVLGSLLVFAGITGVTGLAEKMRFTGLAAWVAGGLSGFFGGLVGNQGGIRSAALFGLEINGKKEFVATATGIALAVDLVRMPVYMATQTREILSIWPLILIASVGVLIGTELGVKAIGVIPEILFKKVVASIILLIGLLILLLR